MQRGNAYCIQSKNTIIRLNNSIHNDYIILNNEINCFKLVKRDNVLLIILGNIGAKIGSLAIRFDSTRFFKESSSFRFDSSTRNRIFGRFRYSESNIRSIPIVGIENRTDGQSSKER